MKIRMLFLLLIVGIVFLGGSVVAQDVEVPCDNEGKVESITPKLNEQLRMFDDFAGFKEAKLFQTSETEFVLEVIYVEQGKTLRKRLPKTAEEVAELRRRVSLAMGGKDISSGMNQEGRTKLIIAASGATLTGYAVAVPVIAGVEGRFSVGLYLLTGAMGFIVPYQLTKNIPVSNPAANFYIYGTFSGAYHGLMVNYLIAGDNGSFRVATASATIGSIAESIGGFQLASRQNLTRGDVDMINIGMYYGLGMGVGTALLAELDNVRGHSGLVLAGSALGFVAGNMERKRQNYTKGDAEVVGVTGATLGYTVPALMYVFNIDGTKPYVAGMMAGATAGLYLGTRMVTGMNFSGADTRLMGLGGAAGLMFGLGVAHLIKPEESRLYAGCSSVGMTAGYLVMYNRARDKAGREDASNLGWRLRWHPENLFSRKIDPRYEKPLPTQPFASLEFDVR